MTILFNLVPSREIHQNLRWFRQLHDGRKEIITERREGLLELDFGWMKSSVVQDR